MKNTRARLLFAGTTTVLFSLLLTATARTENLQQTSSGPAPPYRSVWDGVYTEKQAQRGEAVYRETCSSCHGDKLTGKESENAPALTGEKFEMEWKDHTVGDLFRKILRKMPQDDPGTLTPQQSADLAAFLLSFNKFPAGKNELPADNEPLAGIHFAAKKPDQKTSANKACKKLLSTSSAFSVLTPWFLLLLVAFAFPQSFSPCKLRDSVSPW